MERIKKLVTALEQIETILAPLYFEDRCSEQVKDAYLTAMEAIADHRISEREPREEKV